MDLDAVRQMMGLPPIDEIMDVAYVDEGRSQASFSPPEPSSPAQSQHARAPNPLFHARNEPQRRRGYVEELDDDDVQAVQGAPPAIEHNAPLHAEPATIEEEVAAIVAKSLHDIQTLIRLLNKKCLFTDIPPEEKQFEMMELTETIACICVDGITSFVELGHPLHRICPANTSVEAGKLYEALFIYFVVVYPYTGMLQRSPYGLMMLRELVFLAIAHMRQAVMALAPDSVYLFERVKYPQEFGNVVLDMNTLDDRPIAELSLHATLSHLFTLFASSNTCVYSREYEQLYNHLLFRGFYLITHSAPTTVMNVVSAIVAPDPAAPDVLIAKPAVISDLCILSYSMSTKFSQFGMFAQVIHMDEIPLARKILFSELSFMVHWIASNASAADGGPVRGEYIRQQLRAGEREMYKRLFSASAVDDPNFVLGVMRPASFGRIQTRSMRSPSRMLTEYVSETPDEVALMLATRHTVLSHFIGLYEPMQKRIGNAIVLERDLATVIASINNAVHPVVAQVFNHCQLMTEGRILYCYNNIVCTLVAWFREIQHRHRGSLCGVDIRHFTLDAIFPMSGTMDRASASVYHMALRDAIYSRVKDLVVHDYDPFIADAPDAPFDYSRFPDNLVRSRPPPAPIPYVTPCAKRINTSFAATIQAFKEKHNIK